MSKYRWTGYVIEDKAVIKDEQGIMIGFFQMEKGLPCITSWAEWITFCLNYWEENYSDEETEFADKWFQKRLYD
jgi:hypothetical protein